jgi:hypothetical protein
VAQVRPATGPVPAQKPVTTRIPSTGRASGSRSTTRREVPSRRAGGKSNNTPILIGAGVGGVLLLIIVIAVAAGGGTSKRDDASKAKKASAPLDVSGMERLAEQKCQEGLAMIQQSEDKMTGKSLSTGDKSKLKSDLERGISLIQEGNTLYESANAKSGHTYDTVKYNKAMKAARMKIGELGSAR